MMSEYAILIHRSGNEIFVLEKVLDNPDGATIIAAGKRIFA